MGRILAIAVLICCCSCEENSVFHQYQTVDNQGWSKGKTYNFTIQELDSLKRYDLFLRLRNNHNYPYSNLFVITTMNFPNGKQVKDTLEYVMAAPDGQWLGQGVGELKENKLWYKEGVRFRESGAYSFSIAHAMRKNGSATGDATLPGITEVGLQITEQTN